MWFGTKEYARWVKVPSPSPQYARAGHSDRIDYMNGGSVARVSSTGSGERTLAWNVLTPEQKNAITEYASGMHGDLVYWVDPVNARLNMLSPHWSAPGLTALDAPPLWTRGQRPQRVTNPNQSFGYPRVAAQYTRVGGEVSRKFYVPIPPDHTALVGVHGSNGSGSLRMRYERVVAGSATGSADLTTLSVATDQRFSHEFPYSPGATEGLHIFLGSGSGSITLAGIMVQVVPTVEADVTQRGGFIHGDGVSGGRIVEQNVTPVRVRKNTPDSRFALSMRILEVEDYL